MVPEGAEIEDYEHPACEISSGERRFCRKCGSALWLYDPNWPELVHPFASAIDTDLPKPPSRTHVLIKYKASWVTPKQSSTRSWRTNRSAC